nr:hypothetical protein CFP56_70688 [Quercus suber]
MEIGEVGWDKELELEIVAPKIESLEIIGKFYNMKKFKIKDVLALVEVKLDFEIPEPDETETDEDLLRVCIKSRNLLLANGVSWMIFLDYSLYQFFSPLFRLLNTTLYAFLDC